MSCARPRIVRLDETGRSQKGRANSKQRCWHGPSHGGKAAAVAEVARHPGRGSLSCCWAFLLLAIIRGQIDVAVCVIVYNMPGDWPLWFSRVSENRTRLVLDDTGEWVCSPLPCVSRGSRSNKQPIYNLC